MTIDYADVFDILAEAMPECPPEPGDWEDRLSYIYINNLVRYVCDRAYLDFEPLLKQFAALMERLYTEGDEPVCDLAHEALDSLWCHDEERDVVARYFGPKTTEVWLRICAGEHGQ